MSALREVDRDLDQIVVDAAHLAEVRKSVSARGKLALATADAELAALAAGTIPRTAEHPRPDTEPPPPLDPYAPDDEEGPPSGQIDVPDEVLASAELPAVLAVSQPPAAAEPLSLELDSGETPLAEPEELAPIATTASTVFPIEAPMSAAVAADYHAPPTETRSLGDDPDADLASLLGDADPMRDEGAMPLVGSEIEPEPTTMFTAEDAERYSRPPSALESALEDLEPASDIELDIEEIELDEELEEDAPAPAAAAPRTGPPPPPPRTSPPQAPGTRPSEAPAPGRGFLGKLLQRKP